MKFIFGGQGSDSSGVTLFGIVLMLSIGGALAFLLMWVIPNIRQEGLNQQRLLDVSSIKQGLASYISKNDSIPKSWSDVQDQIDLDHYDIDNIFESFKSNDKVADSLDKARQAATAVKDYIGVFARSQCDQQWIENAANTNLIKEGDESQMVILYVLEGKGLVCEQVSSEDNNAETETTTQDGAT